MKAAWHKERRPKEAWQEDAQVPPLLLNYKLLFYTSKLLGINPYGWAAFRERHELECSWQGTGAVVVVWVVAFGLFNLMVYTLEESEPKTSPASAGRLNQAMGFLLTYFGVAMVLVDCVSVLLNQRRLPGWFRSMHSIDEQLRALDLAVDDSIIRRLLPNLLAIVIGCECASYLATLSLLQELGWFKSALWAVCFWPTLLNAVDKLWFNMGIRGIWNRLLVINQAQEALVARHEAQQCADDGGCGGASSTASTVRVSSANRVAPAPTPDVYFGEFVGDRGLGSRRRAAVELSGAADVLEEYLSRLCQLHDNLCTLGRVQNELWAYPNVALMGHDFVLVTAQLYFSVCWSLGETVPIWFRPVVNPFAAFAYLSYAIAKCLRVMLLNTFASQESKRTGVCLHKCAVAADTADVYDIVNHLSLKLMQHGVDFCSTGFLAVNMTTMFALLGTIATYSIILIQFKLSGVQYAAGLAASSARGAANSTYFVANISATLSPFFELMGVDLDPSKL